MTLPDRRKRGSITVCAITPWHGSCVGCPRCEMRHLMRDDHFQRWYCLGCGYLLNDEDIPPVPEVAVTYVALDEERRDADR